MKTLVGKQRAGWERGVDTYSMGSAFPPGAGGKRWYYMWLYFTPTCRILQFSMLKFMNSGEKQFTFGSSFELEKKPLILLRWSNSLTHDQFLWRQNQVIWSGLCNCCLLNRVGVIIRVVIWNKEYQRLTFLETSQMFFLLVWELAGPRVPCDMFQSWRSQWGESLFEQGRQWIEKSPSLAIGRSDCQSSLATSSLPNPGWIS